MAGRRVVRRYQFALAIFELAQTLQQSITTLARLVEVRLELRPDQLEHLLRKEFPLPALFLAVRQNQVIRDRSGPGVEWFGSVVLIELLPDADAHPLHDFFRVLPVWGEGVNVGKKATL